MKANPRILKMLSERTKCWSCKRRFDKPLLLPVEKPERGKFQPNFNAEILFHQYDTHGIDPEVTIAWIVGSIYGQELTEFGVRL